MLTYVFHFQTGLRTHCAIVPFLDFLRMLSFQVIDSINTCVTPPLGGGRFSRVSGWMGWGCGPPPPTGQSIRPGHNNFPESSVDLGWILGRVRYKEGAGFWRGVPPPYTGPDRPVLVRTPQLPKGIDPGG